MFAFVALSILTGCATTKSSFTGDWLLTLNSHQKFNVRIDQHSHSELVINSEEAMISGNYFFSSGEIILQQPNQPRLNILTLKPLNDGEWVVTDAPSRAMIGIQLLGAKLHRKVP